jgi:hypothetical protein
VHDWQTLPNEDTVSSWWYGVWSTPRTYNFHFQFLVNGSRLSQEPARRFFVLLRCCRNLHSFLTIEGLASTFFHLAQAMAMVSSRYFLGSCYRPFPVRYNWSVCAREMHSTSEFAKIVLSKCVCYHMYLNSETMNSNPSTVYYCV